MTESSQSNQPADPGSALQKLSAALEAGNIKQAHRLKSRFLKYSTNSYPRSIQTKFHLLDAKLKELEDWQQYATNSKRSELCEKMEHLKAHNEIHPDEKAKAIRELQILWRQLGPSDSSEGQKLWQRFKHTGDLAFSVCAEYFDTKRVQREKNLHERIKICDSLALYLAENDWRQTNWKAVSQIVKTARSEWRRFEDIPHARRKEMQKRFFQSLGAIEDKLKEEQDRNHKLKQGYIQQVKIFLEADNNVTTAVREVKNIQNAWKQVGITDRGMDQRMWKEFRKYCDAIFDKRDEGKHQREQFQAVELEKADRLCLELESLLNDDLRIETFREVCKKFSLLSTGKKHPAQHRFERLKKRARTIINDGGKRKEETTFFEFVRKVGLCEQLESGADLDNINAQWQSETRLAEELELLLDERLQQARSGDYHYADPKLTEEICVRVEMLAHISSPDSSQDVRIRLQVERLDQQLSKGIKETRNRLEQLRDLQIQWYSMGPIQRDGKELKKRFGKAEKAIMSVRA